MELVMVRDTTLERLRAAEAALLRIRRGQSPTTEKLAEAPQLDFWTIAADDRGSLALASGYRPSPPARGAHATDQCADPDRQRPQSCPCGVPLLPARRAVQRYRGRGGRS